MADPWQTPEWRAHCASERKRFREGACFKLMLDASPSGEKGVVDVHGCDEEMWRAAHDPVGKVRLELSRMARKYGDDPSSPFMREYIRRACEAVQREMENDPAYRKRCLSKQLDDGNVDAWSLKELKAACKSSGVPISGTKSKLVERLRAWVEEPAPKRLHTELSETDFTAETD
mmetsp:Transcript_24087/g.74253  ORF Transcript_24087/g.74253 Transcript_24087/m.74253 type:complete len:174 (+) Transcript_24087:315-836(+)